MNDTIHPSAPENGFFDTDMGADAENVYTSEQHARGLFITAISSEDDIEIGRTSYGPMRKLTESEVYTISMNNWSQPNPDMQIGEVYAGVHSDGLTILARIGDDYYLGDEAPIPTPAEDAATRKIIADALASVSRGMTGPTLTSPSQISQ